MKDLEKRFKSLKEEHEKRKYLPFWDVLDIDRHPKRNMLLLFMFRLIMTMVQVHFMYHPDENW